MAQKWSIALLLILLLAVPGSSLLAQSSTLSSTFTYQGYLSNNGEPLTGQCDLQFSLFDAAAAGNQIGATLNRNNVIFSSGTFSVQLDFGATAFNGTDRYLAISLRCPTGSGAYTPLIPRQPITPTPYALGLYGLEVQYNATSPNLIGGYSGNNVSAGVVGSFIGAGGEAGEPNVVTEDYGFVGGGSSNSSGGLYSTVGGGFDNDADNYYAVVSGGIANDALNYASVVAGGDFNTASGSRSTVGGGTSNTASHQQATISGGFTNLASAEYATIGGGYENFANGGAATIAGGYENSATAIEATVGGGYSNIASGITATVAGGYDNTASGFGATIPGGRQNLASGEYSFAGGRRANAAHNGAFVWADSTDLDFSSNLANQFFVRATGGVAFYTNTALTNGCTLSTGGGTWSCTSDRNTKENFAAVDTQAVLTDVLNMPITTWVYKDTEVRHIGPMAQDFYAAFGVGEDDRHISMVDSDGVALAAIQGLYQVVQDKDAQITSLQTENETLKTRLDDLDQRLAALEAIASPSQAGFDPAMLLVIVAFGGLGVYGLRSKRSQ